MSVANNQQEDYMVGIVREKTDEIVSLLENTGYYLINEQCKRAYEVYKKDDGSMLTTLDLASDLIIKDGLKSLFGNIPVLSEENEQEDNIKIADKQHMFLLDPIDGTRSFNASKEFTINLAFCVGGEPKIGFIHNPIKKVLLFGDESKSFRRSGGNTTKILRFSKIDGLKFKQEQQPFRVACGHTFFNSIGIEKIAERIQEHGYNFDKSNIVKFSAMEKLLSLIDNDCDAFVCADCCKDWDILPAVPILKAIGGKFTTNNPTVFNGGNFEQGIFIAGKCQDFVDDLVEVFTH